MNIRKPQRAGHRAVLHIDATPEQVFPLLCPVREVDYARGWQPTLVVSESGVAEAGCIFTTPTGDGESIWVITAYEPPNRIAFVKVTPGHTVGEIEFTLAPLPDGTTAASVAYSYTAIGPAGESTVAGFTAEHYAGFMQEMESEMNHYIRTGTMLPA